MVERRTSRAAVAVCVLALAAGCGSGRKARREAPPPKAPDQPTLSLTSATAPAILRPGDVLFRYVNPKDPLADAITGRIIRKSQALIERAMARRKDELDKALAAGDPNAVHVALYLGEGMTAEAFGTTPDDASVNTWPFFTEGRKGTSWRIFRHRDPRIAAAMVEVARLWADGRMKYAMPFAVFVRDATWGPRARASVRAYVEAAHTRGGPPQVEGMFCSQFVMAVLQVAAVAVHLGATEVTDAALDSLPREARIDSVASPLRVYGEWVESGAFVPVGHGLLE